MGTPICFFYEPATLDWMETAGQRIRSKRKGLGWNQGDLAEKVGIDQSTISDIERGAGFSADLLMRLSDALQTTPQAIMRGAPAAASTSDLSPELAQLSAAVEQLPQRQRDWVMLNLREAVKLARETLTQNAVTPPPTDVPQESTGRRKHA